MKRYGKLIWSAVIVLAVCFVLHAGQVICAKCGFENDDNRATCSHCNAPLPAKAAATEAAAPPAPAGLLPGKLGFLDPAIVEDEINEARKCLPEKAEVAKLFLLNAQALEMLTDPARSSNRPAAIEELVKRCDQGGSLVRIKCPACAGTGLRKYITSSLRGEQNVRDTQGLPCSDCSGTGYITRRAVVSDVKYRRARALDEYRSAQQARKYVPIGAAWVPQILETQLTVRQQAQICRVTAAPCSVCSGLGRTDCPTCHGEGQIKCTNHGCVNGRVKVVKSDSRLIKIRDADEEICKVCGGTGRLTCEKCGGRGSLLCSACGGSGQRPPCAKCSAQGFLTCTRCNGMGQTAKGICDACGGEGLVLCPTCRGDGRKR